MGRCREVLTNHLRQRYPCTHTSDPVMTVLTVASQFSDVGTACALTSDTCPCQCALRTVVAALTPIRCPIHTCRHFSTNSKNKVTRCLVEHVTKSSALLVVNVMAVVHAACAIHISSTEGAPGRDSGTGTRTRARPHTHSVYDEDIQRWASWPPHARGMTAATVQCTYYRP